MGEGEPARDSRRRRLSVVLGVVFATAYILGPGPGLLLVNPDPDDPAALRTVLGLPILYLWGIIWFGVLASVLVVAYLKLWRDDEGDER